MLCLRDSQLHVAKINYAATHVLMLVSRLGLIKLWHKLGLSPAMGFLNENDSFGLLCNLGRIVVRSVLNHGLFNDFRFSLNISGLFQGGQRGHTSQHPDV